MRIEDLKDEIVQRAIAIDDAARRDFEASFQRGEPVVFTPIQMEVIAMVISEIRAELREEIADERERFYTELSELDLNDEQIEGIAEFASLYVGQKIQELKDEINTEIGTLRADLAVQIGVARGDIAQLVTRKTDAA